MLLRRLFVRASSAGRFAQQAAPALVVAQQSTAQSQIGKTACLALLLVAGGVGTAQAEATTPPDQQKGWNLLSLDQRRRLFFKYERRVRDMSPQEKVFDYFASKRDVGGASFMLAGDMLRAVVPVYPPEGCSFVRSGSLAGEPSPKVPEEESVFFKNFDLDGDGRISFEEYMLFVTLLSIPPEDIEVAFKILDADNSGKIDAGEFSRLLGALQGQAGAQKATTRHLDHTQSGERAGLLRKFFGNDGQKQLTLEAFKGFMDALREELVRLEYQYYDCESKGYMTGRDFAHSIVGSASARFLDEYLNKVQAMPAELADTQITLKELGAFREVLRQLRALLVALEFIQNSSRTVTEADLHWVAEHILHTKLTKAQVDIVFYLFGSNEHGLNPRFMHKVLSRHPATGLRIVYEYQAGQAESGKKSLLDCIRECHSSL